MSIATDRATITAALNGITGITATNALTAKVGAAWIQLLGIDRETGIEELSWKIYIYLPQNENKAVAWFEDNADVLIQGLQHPEEPIESAGYVDSLNPVNLGNTDQPVYGLEITLRS